MNPRRRHVDELKMSLQKNKVDAAIAINNEPRIVPRSGRMVLRSGRGYVTLATNNSKLTPSGRYYFETTGKSPPVGGFDSNQKLIREKEKEYIMMGNGKRRLVRQYDPARGFFF